MRDTLTIFVDMVEGIIMPTPRAPLRCGYATTDLPTTWSRKRRFATHTKPWPAPRHRQHCDSGDLALTTSSRFNPLIEDDVYQVLTLEGRRRHATTLAGRPNKSGRQRSTLGWLISVSTVYGVGEQIRSTPSGHAERSDITVPTHAIGHNTTAAAHQA